MGIQLVRARGLYPKMRERLCISSGLGLLRRSWEKLLSRGTSGISYSPSRAALIRDAWMKKDYISIYISRTWPFLCACTYLDLSVCVQCMWVCLCICVPVYGWWPLCQQKTKIHLREKLATIALWSLCVRAHVEECNSFELWAPSISVHVCLIEMLLQKQ